MRAAIAMAACLILGACSGGPRVLMSGEHSKSVNLHLAGPMTADSDGNVFVLTPSNVARYDPAGHELEELLFEQIEMKALAAVPGGPLLVLSGNRLEAIVAGKRVQIAELPGTGLCLAAGKEAAYLTVSARGEFGLMRYRFQERVLETLCWTAERINALAVVPGGCLVAAGLGVHKIFDPHDGEVRRRLLFAVSGNALSGLASDADAGAIYFSDGDATYAWKEGRVATVFPMGGTLAVARGRLIIADRRHRQILELPDPTAGTAMDSTPVSSAVTPEGADRSAEVRIENRSGTFEGDVLAVAFTIINDSPAWLDRIEVKVGALNSESQPLTESTVVLYRSVAPRSSIVERVSLPLSILDGRGIARDSVKRISAVLLRARESSLRPNVQLALKGVEQRQTRMVAVLEVTNGNPIPVRFASFDVEYFRGEGQPATLKATVETDQQVGAGATRTFEIPLLTNEERSAAESRSGEIKRVMVQFGRMTPAD